MVSMMKEPRYSQEQNPKCPQSAECQECARRAEYMGPEATAGTSTEFKWTTMTIRQYPEEDSGDPEVWLRKFAIDHPREMDELVATTTQEIEELLKLAALAANAFRNDTGAADGRQ